MTTLTYSASYPPTIAKELLRHRGTYTLCTDCVPKDNDEEMNESCLKSMASRDRPVDAPSSDVNS